MYMKSSFYIKLDINDISDFLNVTSEIPNDINICQGQTVASAKSLMGIYALDLSQPIRLIIRDDSENTLVNKFDRWLV